MRRGIKGLLVFFIFILIILVISIEFLIRAENSESTLSSEWWMFGKYLNHTAYDGINFTVIPGLNISTFVTPSSVVWSSPAVAYGSVYIGSSAYVVTNIATFYRLNASNISQQIENFTIFNGSIRTSPVVVNGWVYFGGGPAGYAATLYKLNATNFSQNYTGKQVMNQYSPFIIANSYVYTVLTGFPNAYLYQTNASNISQIIGNYSFPGYSTDMPPTYANGYIYTGNLNPNAQFYQFNASNISFGPIANISTQGWPVESAPVVWNGFVYFGTGGNSLNGTNGTFYQLNATNFSQKIANFSPLGVNVVNGGNIESPAIATIGTNTYVYFGSTADGTFYQLNASNVSQQIANYTVNDTLYNWMEVAPTVANGYVYFGTNYGYMYQLNASNVSQFIGKIFTGGLELSTSAAYARGYIYFGNYFGDNSGKIYQINASNLSLFTIIDTTPPVIYIDGSLQTTYSGSITLNIHMNEPGYCMYSVNGGATNKTFPNVLASYIFYNAVETLSDGNYVANFYCNDTSGNRNDTASFSFTMYTAPSGGGLPPVTPPPTVTGTITSASPGSPAVISVNNPNIGVTNITIAVNQNVSNASLTIKPLNSTTGANFRVSLRRGAFYQAYEINVTGMNNSVITNVTIYFKVNITWLALQNGTTANIYLYRYYNARWNRLPTTYLSQDSTYYYFKSISPGFSTFVVFFGEFDCEPDTTRCFNNEVQLCLGNSTWLVTDKCSISCDNGKCVNSIFDNLNIVYIGAIIGIVAAIILVFYGLIMKFSRRNTGKTSRKSLAKFYRNQSRRQ